MRPAIKAPYSSRTADKFVVRLLPGWREKIEEKARASHQSMNSAILARLEGLVMDEDDSRAMYLNTPYQIGERTFINVKKPEQEMRTLQVTVFEGKVRLSNDRGSIIQEMTFVEYSRLISRVDGF